MIAVPQHHRRDVLLPPFIEIAAVIELDLVRLPYVERLIENQQAEAVARVQKRGRRRIVRRAHGIHARSLQQLHSALFRAIKGRSAERSVVVMNAAAGQLDGLAVEQQSLFRRPGKRADAEWRGHLVDHFAIFANRRDRAVQRGRFRRPERGIRDSDFLRGLVFLARRNAQCRFRAPDFVPHLVEQRRFQGDSRGIRRLIRHPRAD